MAWTQRNQLLVACIIGAIIGVICSLFFNNIFWLPLMIMVAGLVSLFCKSAADIPPEEESKFFDQ
ncbi:MAG: hypothetical protein Q6364_00290 [Candidatus Hermodarchaeota archaeon]|nr:hypothetical protein [Candidatus Hermodarchaeota archaeon]